MKVRKIDADGEVVYGRGTDSLRTNTPEAVAQNVMTRLSLWRGSWYFDVDEGTPWLEEGVGHHAVLDAMLRDRVLDTPGVKSIVSLEYLENTTSRHVTVSLTIETAYGEASLETRL